jgi:hypothetical protein
MYTVVAMTGAPWLAFPLASRPRVTLVRVCTVFGVTPEQGDARDY